MEKRYLIKEQGECDPGIVLTGTITESELIRRLNLIDRLRFANTSEPWDWDIGIDILLHGTEKEQSQCPSGNPSMVYTEKEQPQVAKYCHIDAQSSRICERGTKSCIVQHIPDHLGAGRGIDEPEVIEPPKPTHKEWEEWVENMPSHSMSTRMEWEEKMKDWFLTMPGVPKE